MFVRKKETMWQSVVIRAGDEGESYGHCRKDTVQNFKSKDIESEPDAK